MLLWLCIWRWGDTQRCIYGGVSAENPEQFDTLKSNFLYAMFITQSQDLASNRALQM